MVMSAERYDVVVIGAGMAGLQAAQQLQAADQRVLVVDKGRGVGGRMSTRRIAHYRLDHGAQYMTAKEGDFAAAMRRWQLEGVVAPWFDTLHWHDGTAEPQSKTRPRWVGAHGGINTLPKALAKGLSVHTGHRVIGLDALDDAQGTGWRLRFAAHNPVEAKAVISTMPVPQFLQLCHASSSALLAPAQEDTLAAIRYAPCWTVLLVTDPCPQLQRTCGMKSTDPTAPLGWLADNATKGAAHGSRNTFSLLTLQAGPQWSERHVEADPEWVSATLIAAAEAQLDTRLTVYIKQVHRWRYSNAVSGHPEPVFWVSQTPSLLLAGDAFGGPSKVETAFHSGRQAAQALLASLTIKHH